MRLLLAVLAFVALSVLPVRAQSVEEFYKGKTINLAIGFSVGGGYDLYARHLARHMGKHIPGNPAIVPQNMAGAGSLRLANVLYNVAPKDGTTFGMVGRGVSMEPLLGTDASPACNGTNACDGAGNCKKAPGQACTQNSQCASGSCNANVCQ